MSEFSNHENYNCRILLDDGQEYLVYANWLHNEHLDNWKGWSCDAGKTRFYIDANLDVYGGECQNDYLGNAIDGINILDNGTTCKQDRCNGCTDDLAVAKSKD